MEKMLDGKVCIVTGGGRGIAREACLMFASEGGKVVVCDLDEAPAQETVDEIKKIGRTGRCSFRGHNRGRRPREDHQDCHRYLQRDRRYRQRCRVHLGQHDPEYDGQAMGRHDRRPPQGSLPDTAGGGQLHSREDQGRTGRRQTGDEEGGQHLLHGGYMRQSRTG